VSIPNLLTIAGSDPSGGAGIQADLKTFAAHRCFGTSVVTALTAQNTRGVTGVLPTDPGFVQAQLETLLDDVRIDAVKIGKLGSPEVARVVADALRGPLAGVPVVLDPVLVATSGDTLSASGVPEAIGELLELCTVVTPNLPEAALLSGRTQATGRDEMERQAAVLLERGAPAVMLKGGHLSADVMWDLVAQRSETTQRSETAQGGETAPGGETVWLQQQRVHTRNTHGTGCTLSSAIAARLAHGASLAEACSGAKAWLTAALAASDELRVAGSAGSEEAASEALGHGPVNHLVPVEQGTPGTVG